MRSYLTKQRGIKKKKRKDNEYMFHSLLASVGVQLAEKTMQRPVINYFFSPKYLPVFLPEYKG